MAELAQTQSFCIYRNVKILTEKIVHFCRHKPYTQTVGCNSGIKN